MREIPLTRGYVALVDDEDYEALARFKWHAMSAGKVFYAARTVVNSKILMHRVIAAPGSSRVVDHIDGNTLNNRRQNLRCVSSGENRVNTRHPKPNKSGYRGVKFDPRRGTWSASVKHNGATHFLGTFLNPVPAAEAYDIAARRLYGPYCAVNFPDGSTPPSIDAVREDHASAAGAGPR